MDKNIKQIREQLKALINDDMSKEFVDKVASIDKLIDSVEEERTKQKENYEQLKSDYIEIIKQTSFSSKPEEIEPTEDKPKSFEEMLNEYDVMNKK